MDNQHRQIKGYRDPSQAEIDLMNEVKEMGRIADAMTKKVAMHVTAQRKAAAFIDGEGTRLDAAQPERWAAIARTHFQEGLMALTRAVAQPEFF